MEALGEKIFRFFRFSEFRKIFTPQTWRGVAERSEPPSESREPPSESAESRMHTTYAVASKTNRFLNCGRHMECACYHVSIRLDGNNGPILPLRCPSLIAYSSRKTGWISKVSGLPSRRTLTGYERSAGSCSTRLLKYSAEKTLCSPS